MTYAKTHCLRLVDRHAASTERASRNPAGLVRETPNHGSVELRRTGSQPGRGASTARPPLVRGRGEAGQPGT